MYILVHSSFEYIVRHETDTLADDFIFEASAIEIPALNVVCFIENLTTVIVECFFIS